MTALFVKKLNLSSCIVGVFSDEVCLSGRTVLSPFVRLAPNKNKKQFPLNALNSFPMCPSLLSTPFRQLHVILTHQRSVRVYTAVSMLEESRHRPFVCVCDGCSHPARVACMRERPCYFLDICMLSLKVTPAD